MKTSTPVKQNVRQKQASARRQQILEVAVRLFAQKGVARTTTRQIAQEAGAAEGLIFRYFPTKLDLVRAVTGTPHVVLGDLRKILEESKTQSVEEVIGQIATVWLELLHRESDISSILFGNVALPILRNVMGRTLYEDMLRMEDFLSTCNDIEWTIIRPGRLINGTSVSEYRLAEDFPVGNVTTRPDLAAAILAELGLNGHIHQKISPTKR